ncbi:5'-nucleotidase, lipoprotein e(P4) family [Clostridium baratii str. Sullivan]|uniref:5'-nucleotidase, lipoprotein e(P4) family n=1 Tax=Clostridium baratii str. Sullivan TaxID=1415775 RepID=A0A0A7G0N9_9CLOT|nr:5'-nucleotidase, lipoprotein e(P4) family [Clostridium baratii]AIY84651.1 5'-nucleotidase, lipoprotein e(P4) family [Clostridium baratii str. Sullivan]
MKNSRFQTMIISLIIGLSVGSGTNYILENNHNRIPNAVEVTTSSEATNRDLVNGNILAVAWQQNSGEVNALRYQAYNSAMNYVDKLVKEKTTKPYAVTLDIDETIIDNSPHAGYEIKNSDPYSSENFNKWIQKADAKAIPGAKEFTDYAKSKGIEVFYVSNRKEDIHLDATIKNMKKLGFVNSDKEHILLKTNDSDKAPRWNKIEEKYNLAMYCGDNLGDFPNGYYNKSNEERNKIVKEQSEYFGSKYIVLPNPVYGDFENAIYSYNLNKTPSEKIQDRLNSIKSFK